MSKTTTKNYIKQMVSSETKKNQKQKEKQRHSYNSNWYDSSSDEESWRSGLSGVKQMHMFASTSINLNDSDIQFDSSNKKCYKKNNLESELKARTSVRDAESLSCLGLQSSGKTTHISIRIKVAEYVRSVS